MKKFLSKLICAALAVAFGVMPLFGCGNPYDGKTRVIFWSPPFSEQETRTWLTKYTDLYNETNEDNVYIDLNFIAEDAWDQALKGAQEAGTAPQITFVNYAEIPGDATGGMYTALDDYMSAGVWDDLNDNVKEMVTVGDKHYVYPCFLEPYSILFYSKSAFREAGLDPAAPPASWDELYAAAKTLTTNGRYGIAMPNSSQLGWVMWGFQAMSGSYLLNDNWDTAVVNNSFHEDLFTLFKKMYDEKLTPKVALASYNEISPLAQGKVAMQLCGSWAMGQIKNSYPSIVDDIGYTVCPTQYGENEGATTAALGGWGFAVDGNAENPAEAGKFIEWLLASDPQYVAEFLKDLGYSKFSGRKSVDALLAENDEAKNDPFRNYVSEKIMPYALAEPCYMWEISKQYADSIESVTLLNTPVKTALNKLEAYLNELIVSEGLAGTNPRNPAV